MQDDIAKTYACDVLVIGSGFPAITAERLRLAVVAMHGEGEPARVYQIRVE